MKKLNAITICLFGVIGVFTVAFFIWANKVSYEFSVDYSDKLYDLKIANIEAQAQTYAEANKDIFKDEAEKYITVDDLAKLGFMATNDGKVVDPRNDEKDLNNIKIRLTYKNEKVDVKVITV